jgi:hypothetical protein
VTTHRTRDLKRELMTLAEPFGARLVDIKITGGGHFSRNDRVRSFDLRSLHRLVTQRLACCQKAIIVR